IGILSGHLAARALLERRPESYDSAWRARLGGLLRTSIVNRYAFARMGDRGYTRLMRGIARCRDARRWLADHYPPGWPKTMLLPIARRVVRSRRAPPGCPDAGCDCTWCRTRHEPSRQASAPPRERGADASPAPPSPFSLRYPG